MTDAQQRETARQFFYRWQNKGNEKQDASSYWVEILQDILGVGDVTQRIELEKPVNGPDGNTKYIDVYIPETRVLIEQKSLGIPLDKPQQGHNGMTPYEQAKMYDNGLPFDEKARWIILSNFGEIWIYDMNQKKPEANIVKLTLQELSSKYHVLDFLVSQETKKITQEMEVSLKAGEIVGELYDAFHEQYKNPDNPESLKSLNKLCVRLVFCLYGEDADVFGKKSLFHDYLAQFKPTQARKALRDLFRVLNQKPEERDEYLADDDPILASFPYVNGGLFGGDDIEIPSFTDEIMDLILNRASENFDWSGINGTIFGAVFESTLNPETRRSGGMHYTSFQNIHKVIDPLFLNDLVAEFEDIKAINVWKTKKSKLETFQNKLSSLCFMDPAAGSGNFLTETYTSLRKIENEVIKLLTRGQMTLGDVVNPIKVSIGQFAGIEINDFAVTVARTALWIAENQMMKETEDIVQMDLDFLPLKTTARIVEGNALRMDWNDVVDKSKLNYIMGNPPFHGFTFMTAPQKEDMELLFPGVKNLDYVCAWYKKASDMIQNTRIEVAFVSTNSITQGETVGRFWNFMKENFINFAYTTFVWDSEASLKAHVHCVIIGFAKWERQKKTIFTENSEITASHINPYLIDGEDIIVESRNKPLCNVPKMIYGNKPADGGFLIIENEDYENFVKNDPLSKQFIKPLLGASEYIKGKKRWCLWLEGVAPDEIKKCPLVLDRVKKCRESRLRSIAAGIRKFADTPTLFAQRTQPTDKDFIIVPRVSSQNRRYVPMGFIKAGTIVTDRVQIIPDADLYDFGVIISNVHMAWMRVTCMRLKSDYSYSKDIVYNNFIWPSAADTQKAKIAETARAILDARAMYPGSTLADLYDPDLMPLELRKAHARNDAAVMQAYGMPIKTTDEAACVSWLMRLYKETMKKGKQR